MKYMIASDIHGSAKWCERLMEVFRSEAPQRLVLLGDLLYHGPRNDLPEDYDPRRVAALLNAVAPRLLCVRGNCEAEVDQMMLNFPVMADYCALMTEGHVIYATHGHHFSEDNPPPLADGDVLLCGHTHVPGLCRHEGFVYANPGSVSIPKSNSPHSCALIQDGEMIFIDLQRGEYDRQRLWPRQ